MERAQTRVEHLELSLECCLSQLIPPRFEPDAGLDDVPDRLGDALDLAGARPELLDPREFTEQVGEALLLLAGDGPVDGIEVRAEDSLESIPEDAMQDLRPSTRVDREECELVVREDPAPGALCGHAPSGFVGVEMLRSTGLGYDGIVLRFEIACASLQGLSQSARGDLEAAETRKRIGDLPIAQSEPHPHIDRVQESLRAEAHGRVEEPVLVPRSPGLSSAARGAIKALHEERDVGPRRNQLLHVVAREVVGLAGIPVAEGAHLERRDLLSIDVVRDRSARPDVPRFPAWLPPGLLPLGLLSSKGWRVRVPTLTRSDGRAGMGGLRTLRNEELPTEILVLPLEVLDRFSLASILALESIALDLCLPSSLAFGLEILTLAAEALSKALECPTKAPQPSEETASRVF